MMTLKKALLLSIITPLMIIGFLTIYPTTSHAMSLYNPANPFWNHAHWVTLQQNVTVTKIRNTDPMSNRYRVATYSLKKGHHLKLFHSAVNVSWGLDSGKFNTNRTYTYAVNKSDNSHSWFKFGIH